MIHAIEYLHIQQNIVFRCERRIPESKRLALFKPLRITFFIGTIQLCGLSAMQSNKSGRHVDIATFNSNDT